MEASKNATLGVGTYSIPYEPDHFVFHAIILLLFTCGIIYSKRDKGIQLPEFNPRKQFEITDTSRVGYFMQHSIELLTKAREQFGSRPFKLFCDWGELIVLPPSMVDVIKSDRRFDFAISATDVRSHTMVPSQQSGC